MAMMMDIPAAAAVPSPKPMAKAGSVKGQEESFRGTLKEQTLKQAQEAKRPQGETRKSQPEPTEATPTDSALLSPEAAVQETVELPSDVETPQDMKENIAVAVFQSPDIAKVPLAATTTENVASSPAAAKVDVPKNNCIEHAPLTIQNEKPDTAHPAKQEPVSSKAPDQIPGDIVRPEFQPNGMRDNVSDSVSEVVKPQVDIQQQAEVQPDKALPKAPQSGLLEASFAGILQSGSKGNPWAEVRPLRASDATQMLTEDIEAKSGPVAKLTVTEETGENSADSILEQAAQPADSLETAKGQNSGQNGQSVFESTLVSSGTGNKDQGQTSPLQSNAPANAPLPSASFNEEVRILDQVMMKLPFNRTEGNDRIIIKLYPEELGEVKLDLTRDKDQLKVHLFAQTQHVQEILEKHLPRLQEALNNQGIQFDEIKVSVDSQRSQGREFQDRNNQAASFIRPGQNGTPRQAELAMAANSFRPGQGGLSLRI